MRKYDWQLGSGAARPEGIFWFTSAPAHVGPPDADGWRRRTSSAGRKFREREVRPGVVEREYVANNGFEARA